MYKELSDYTVNRPTDKTSRERMREQVEKLIRRHNRESHPTIHLHLPLKDEANFSEARSRNTCFDKEYDPKMVDGCWFAVPYWRDRNHVSVRGYFFKKVKSGKQE